MDYKITEKQEEFLDGFICERLKEGNNRDLIQDFKNKRGTGLVRYLNRLALADDSEGIIANYVVKTPEGLPIMFFSLKCGALFEELDEKEIEEEAKRLTQIFQEVITISGDEREELLEGFIENIRRERGISTDQAFMAIINQANQAKQSKNELKKLVYRIKEDKRVESNKRIIRVKHTYAGVEIVNLCINDEQKENVKRLFKENKINHNIGEVFFWWVIVPKILKIQEIVGCQYTFLFAADTSPEGSLLNYYHVVLKFHQPDDVATNKPIYDMCCHFMCQEIKLLKKNKEKFLEMFNEDKSDAI